MISPGNGILLNNKRKYTSDTCNNIAEPEKIKWKKLDPKRYPETLLAKPDIKVFLWEKLYEQEKVLYILKIFNFEKPKETKVSSLA